ncbi:unnamed protein product, partial [Mesorhabditis spiculigera]
MASIRLPLCIGLFLTVVLTQKAQYTDDVGRHQFYPLAASAYTNPQTCINKWLGAQLKRQINVDCDMLKGDTCSGYTAVSPDKKIIALVFRGTTTDEQLLAEIDETLRKKIPLGAGTVDEYFYDGFNKLWTGGMKDDFLSLRSKYPSFDIYVTGHSLGGAMSTIAANYLVLTQNVPAASIKHMTFGEPRVGDQAFADDHDARFTYSFRVTNHNDVGPHIPPKFLSFQNHQTEIWYNNDMSTANFTVCSGQEDPNCSDSVTLLHYSIPEHRQYYGVNLDDWINVFYSSTMRLYTEFLLFFPLIALAMSKKRRLQAQRVLPAFGHEDQGRCVRYEDGNTRDEWCRDPATACAC